MGKIFLSEERGEDLMRWAKNLEALGCAIGALTDAERRYSDTTLEVHGESLGHIIEDYAVAIHQTAEEAYGVITAFFKEKNKACVQPRNGTEAQGS